MLAIKASRLYNAVQKFINLNPASYTGDGTVEQFTFQIESNTNWEVTSMNSWISVDTLNGSNNATVAVSLSENTSTGIRTGNVRVRNVNEGIEKFVGINQQESNDYTFDFQLTTTKTSSPTAEDGSATLTLLGSGVAPFTVDWTSQYWGRNDTLNSNTATNTFGSLGVGNVTCTVTDANGKTKSVTVEITVAPELDLGDYELNIVQVDFNDHQVSSNIINSTELKNKLMPYYGTSANYNNKVRYVGGTNRSQMEAELNIPQIDWGSAGYAYARFLKLAEGYSADKRINIFLVSDSNSGSNSNSYQQIWLDGMTSTSPWDVNDKTAIYDSDIADFKAKQSTLNTAHNAFIQQIWGSGGTGGATLEVEDKFNLFLEAIDQGLGAYSPASKNFTQMPNNAAVYQNVNNNRDIDTQGLVDQIVAALHKVGFDGV